MNSEKEKEYRKLCEKMKNEKYEKKEVIIPKIKASVLGIIYAGLLVGIILGIFFYMYGIQNNFEFEYTIFLLQVGISLVVHELLHGIGWKFSSDLKWKEIKFGFSSLMPYCHCKEIISQKQYLIGVITPVFVLGIIPVALAFIFKSAFLISFGCLNIMLAGGDLLICIYLLRENGEKVIDHPNEAGFVLFKKNQQKETSYEKSSIN